MSSKISPLYLVACAALALLPRIAFADDLMGRITDPQGNRVADAQIRLVDRKTGDLRAARSSPEGEYRFSEIAAGEYVIEVDASSSALKASRSVTVEGDQSLDIALAISGAAVEVIVTASTTPVAIQEVAKAVDVVDADEIARRDELSIVDSIRSLPGVRVKQLEGPGSAVSIKTRGLRAQDTAVLVDGMPFRDAASLQADASAFLGDMTIVDTERIEFVRGSGSSLYGSNALGGVMNISSRPGGGPPRADIRLEGGGLGMIRGVVSAGGGLLQDRFTYSAAGAHLNVTKGVRNGMPYRNTSAQGSAKYNFTPGISLSGKLWFADGYLTSTESPTFPAAILANFPATGQVRAIPLPISELEKFEQKQPYSVGNATFIPNQIDPDGRRVSSFFTGTLNFQHQLSSRTSYRVGYSGVDTERTYIDGPAGPGSFEPVYPNRGEFNGRTDTLQLRLDQTAGAHQSITFGYEFVREKYDNFNTDQSPNPPTNSTTLKQNSNAVFAQDQIRLLDGQLQLTVAARAQSFGLDAPTFSGTTTSPYDGITVSTHNAYTGDGALAYFFRSSQTKLRTHVGNSFRAPSTYERFGGSFSSFSQSFTYYGDSRLRPERAIALDGGIDQWLLGSKLQLSGTVFYTNLQETVLFLNSLSNDPFKRPFGGYANGGGGIARGVEISAHASPTAKTQLQIAYTYTNSDSRTPTIGANYYSIPGQSPHTFALTATQWFPHRFNASFDLFAVSDYTLSPFGALGRQLVFDEPVKADVVLHHEIPLKADRTLEIYGKVENILNRRPFEDGFMGPAAWAIAGLQFKY